MVLLQVLLLTLQVVHELLNDPSGHVDCSSSTASPGCEDLLLLIVSQLLKCLGTDSRESMELCHHLLHASHELSALALPPVTFTFKQSLAPIAPPPATTCQLQIWCQGACEDLGPVLAGFGPVPGTHLKLTRAAAAS